MCTPADIVSVRSQSQNEIVTRWTGCLGAMDRPPVHIRNGSVTVAPWWHAFSPSKLIQLIVLFFQTLTSPDSAAMIRARNANPSAARAPKPPAGRPLGGNVRTLNTRDCGAGG